MTIAELFIAIGFKIEGADQATALETTLKNITKAALEAKAALAGLSGVKLPAVAAPVVPGGGVVPPPLPVIPGASTAPVVPGVPRGTRQPAMPPTWQQNFAKILQQAKQAVPALSPVISVMKNITGSAVAGAAALVAMGAGFLVMANSARKAGGALMDFELSTGLSAESLQRLQRIAARFGIEGREVEDTVTGIQDRLTKMSRGMDDDFAIPLSFFGLSSDPYQDPVAVIEKVAKRIRELRPEELQFARQLAKEGFGFSNRTFARMRSGEITGADQIQKNLVLTEKQIAALDELNQSWNGIGAAFVSLKDKFVAVFSDDLIKIFVLIEKSTSWLAGVLDRIDGMAWLKALMVNMVPGGASLMSMANMASASVPEKVSGSVAVTQYNQPTIQIDGSVSPRETARQVDANLWRSYNETFRQAPAGGW